MSIHTGCDGALEDDLLSLASEKQIGMEMEAYEMSEPTQEEVYEAKIDNVSDRLLDCVAEILYLLTDKGANLVAYHRKCISDFVAKNFTPTEVFGKEAIIREALKHLEKK